MAKSFKKVIGSDLSDLANLLAQHGRKNDTLLAHISPREAKLLKKAGGSGTINKKTGLMEFAEDDTFSQVGYQPDTGYQAGYEPSQGGTSDFTFAPDSQGPSSQSPNAAPTGQDFAPTPGNPSGFNVAPAGTGAPGYGAAPVGDVASQPLPPALTVQDQQSFTGTPATDAQKDKYPSPGNSGFLSKLTSGDTLAKLGLAAGIGGLGVVQGKKANANAGQLQAQQTALGAPYQQAGQALISGANQGNLTPAGQQALQAAQAQAQQGVANRGGAGVAQVANQLAQLKAQLLQQQLDYGMKLSGLGDQIVAGAIRDGWQADQQAQQLQGNYFDAAFKVLGALK